MVAAASSMVALIVMIAAENAQARRPVRRAWAMSALALVLFAGLATAMIAVGRALPG